MISYCYNCKDYLEHKGQGFITCTKCGGFKADRSKEVIEQLDRIFAKMVRAAHKKADRRRDG